MNILITPTGSAGPCFVTTGNTVNAMTEIFRTNVQSAADAQVLVAALRAALGCQPSFDLEDCDRVLRVAGLGSGQAVTQVMDIVARHGFTASVLPG